MNISLSTSIYSEVLQFPSYNIRDSSSFKLQGSSSSKELVFNVVAYFRRCKRGERVDINQGICIQCESGTYSFVDNSIISTCNICPSLAKKCFGDKVELYDGYWRRSPFSITILKCPMSESCIGSATFGNYSCTRGYFGPMCALCADDFYQSADQCIECQSRAFSLVKF